VSDKAEVALHWGGGRHHAHSNRASGFCYVNDVVLGVKKLRRRFSRILYIDIDIHHADGVQDAFYDTNEVMTVSFHRLANGFFPCTGAAKDKGRSNGIGYNLNVIIPRGCDDKNFIQIFKHALTNLLDAYKPDAVVLCVGADGLKDDPLVGNMDGWSLTSEGLAECVRTTSELCQGIKLLLLGGGGYDPVRAARTFLLCTAAACESARPGMLKKNSHETFQGTDTFRDMALISALSMKVRTLKEQKNEIELMNCLKLETKLIWRLCISKRGRISTTRPHSLVPLKMKKTY
jgi:histone deacetylase 8